MLHSDTTFRSMQNDSDMDQLHREIQKMENRERRIDTLAKIVLIALLAMIVPTILIFGVAVIVGFIIVACITASIIALYSLIFGSKRFQRIMEELTT